MIRGLNILNTINQHIAPQRIGTSLHYANRTLLCELIRSGAVDQAYQSLMAGTDLNQIGKNGNTPLHEACKRGYTHFAALLLSKGADYTICNSANQSALSQDFTDITTIHRIRQEYQRLSVYPYDKKSRDQQVNSYVDLLNKNGLVKISGVVNPEQLKKLKNEFSVFIDRMKIDQLHMRNNYTHYDQKEYWYAKHRAYVTNDALQYSTEMAKLCCNQFLINIANHYLGKISNIKRVYAMRYLSYHQIELDQFSWHHDMEDKQLKALLLLTDVGEQDQCMEYVKGSQKPFHPYQRYFKNNLDFDYCNTYISNPEISRTFGVAGDIFMFDSNGMHRGVRTAGRVRDAYFIEFTAGKNKNNIWGSEVTGSHIEISKNDINSPLWQLLNTTPKWIRSKTQPPRKHPSWIESLQNPQLWV